MQDNILYVLLSKLTWRTMVDISHQLEVGVILVVLIIKYVIFQLVYPFFEGVDFELIKSNTSLNSLVSHSFLISSSSIPVQALTR